MAVLVHQLVALARLVEREHPPEARVDLPFDDKLVERVGLVIVGEVGALEALLAHPEVPQVDIRVVAGGAGADDHHAARIAHELARRDGVLPGVFEHDARALALAEDVPDRLAERAGAARELAHRLVVGPVRKPAPVVEVLAVDAADGAEAHAVFVLRRA
jgi:hypothetical protein